MNWKLGIAAAAVIGLAVSGYLLGGPDADSDGTTSAPGRAPKAAVAAGPRADESGAAAAPSTTPPADRTAADQPALADKAPATSAADPAVPAVRAAFDRLRGMPAGDDAIALGRELESGLTPHNAGAYIHALVAADHPAVERAAITALAQGDKDVMLALAQQYGGMPADHRGRVLQVFEAASNPDAMQGLAAVVAADTSEKRSPLVMSAMIGIANIGTMDSVQYLLAQVTPAGADFALIALERVRSAQGVEMIRGAAAGNKDGENVDPAFRAALRRIAEGS